MITQNFNVVVANRDEDGNRVDVPIQAHFRYDPDTDPLAVAMTFVAPGSPEIVWTVGRDLLARGCTSVEPYGLGDVRVRQEGRFLVMCLKNANGHVDMMFSHRQVVVFVERTAEAVAIGSENLTADLDEELEAILNG